jgi:hypothetical protein
MLHHTPPGGVATSTRLEPLPAACTVGRSSDNAIATAPVRARGRCSKRHGIFVRDAAGTVRYADLSSRWGSLLLPVSGAPRLLPALRFVALAPGDRVAIGGELTKAVALDSMHVFGWEPAAEEAAEEAEAAPPSALLEALSCTICQEPLRFARVLPCGHAFCDDCITRWFRAKSTCPTCRAGCDEGTVLSSGGACVQLDAATRVAVEAQGDARAVAWLGERDALVSLLAGRLKRKRGD